ncbi:hypothetical protein [Nitrospira sp. Kam-Ns4a]
MAVAELQEKEGGRLEEQGLLFEYTVKALLLAGLLELVLYRLISRLGMHFSKVAEQHDWVRVFFQALSSVGFTLLNFVSVLVFLAILVLLLSRVKTGRGLGWRDGSVVASVSLLLLLTVGFIVSPPAMVGSVVYNAAFLLVLVALLTDYGFAGRPWSQRIMVACFVLGVGSWVYYQTISTAYGLLNVAAMPPFAHEVNRAGEALMVLASILTAWAYGGLPAWTSKNRRQRRRAVAFALVATALFLALLFMDYFLGLYDEALAEKVRKASQGIGWIFQMGMGYTFYLPFVLYVTGLLAWSYAVSKLLMMGRPAGYGLALMFIAGYALQLSHLTLMVVLGLMLLVLDRRKAAVQMGERAAERALASSPVLGGQAS